MAIWDGKKKSDAPVLRCCRNDIMKFLKERAQDLYNSTTTVDPKKFASVMGMFGAAIEMWEAKQSGFDLNTDKGMEDAQKAFDESFKGLSAS